MQLSWRDLVVCQRLPNHKPRPPFPHLHDPDQGLFWDCKKVQFMAEKEKRKKKEEGIF
jgi:hypothetical protein